MKLIEKEEDNGYIKPCTSSYINVGALNGFDFSFKNVSAGQIFNILENSILDVKWDVRESEDYQTILFSRNHMFYTINDSDNIKYYYDYKYTEEIKKDEIILNFKDEKEKIKTPIDFLERVNDFNINQLFDTSIYDYGTINYYFKEDKSNKEKYSSEEATTKQLLFRENCKKVSENYFAISRFNLITHNISVNNEVPNTISELYDEDKKNTMSILGDVSDEYIVEKTVYPEIISASVKEDKSANLFRNNEYLSNILLKELRYSYQGSIIIKYNPQIEIGDTITLIDNISNTYGIFEVDSVEHSLDDRGLLTSLLVKAYWTLTDPILDYYSTEISFKLMTQFKNSKKFNIDSNNKNKISNVLANYLKFIVQSPKYCSLYHKKKETLFYPSTVDSDPTHIPTAMPLKFYPMIKKGVAQIPDNIKYAFFKAPKEKNNYYALSLILSAYANQIIVGGLKSFADSVTSAAVFVFDILISILTFDISEFFKPLFGVTSNKAIDKTFDEVENVSDNVMFSMNTYNPYDSKYNLMGKFDLTFGFFNVRLQNTKDLFSNKNETPTKEKAINYLQEKVRVTKKMLNDVFDCMFLVELYDSFNKPEEKDKKYYFDIRNSSGLKYTYKDFINQVISYTGNDNVDLYKCICTEPIFENSYGKEYGTAIIKKSKFGDTRNFIYRTINLSDNRKAIEIIFDVSYLNIENAIDDNNQINEIKFIFMHNLFGDSQYKDGKNILEIRRENIRVLLEKYKDETTSDNTGIIIIGDFNLHLYLEGNKPIETMANKNNNSFMEIYKKYNFVPQITSLTTIGKDGNVSGNQYDNVLLSSNLIGKVKARAFDYPEIDKIVVSDHIPVYVGLKKLS